jgi:hypothetical protein
MMDGSPALCKNKNDSQSLVRVAELLKWKGCRTARTMAFGLWRMGTHTGMFQQREENSTCHLSQVMSQFE